MPVSQHCQYGVSCLNSVMQKSFTCRGNLVLDVRGCLKYLWFTLCNHRNVIGSSVQVRCISEQPNLLCWCVCISMSDQNVVNPGGPRWSVGCGTQWRCPCIECNHLKVIQQQLRQDGWVSMLRSQLGPCRCCKMSLSYQTRNAGQWAVEITKNTQRISVRNLLQKPKSVSCEIFVQWLCSTYVGIGQWYQKV